MLGILQIYDMNGVGWVGMYDKSQSIFCDGSRVLISHYICKFKNKNTKCPIDAHCHRHCRKDVRITEEHNEFNMNSEIIF